MDKCSCLCFQIVQLDILIIRVGHILIQGMTKQEFGGELLKENGLSLEH